MNLIKPALMLSLVGALQIGPTAAAGPVAPARHTIFIPSIVRDDCASSSRQSYHNVLIDSYYKDNRLTDNNVDFRLQVLGYAKTNVALQTVDYNGSHDDNAPQMKAIFAPARQPQFVTAYRRYDWNWNEAGPPPYGSRAGLNSDWPAAVLDLATTPGESLSIPSRGIPIWDQGVVALLLFADAHNLVLTYTRQDTVSSGYTFYMSNLCVDPGLISAYRGVTDGNGRRTAGQLPGVRNSQPVGTARGTVVTVAIRDTAQFMDPRSRSDWWK